MEPETNREAEPSAVKGNAGDTEDIEGAGDANFQKDERQDDLPRNQNALVRGVEGWGRIILITLGTMIAVIIIAIF